MHDILVIGGGINGTGIARDAAGRGLDVVLCEKDDLAQHTSSASTKLIHGGLRYLEQYDFGLVRKALIEREILLKAAPHIIWPMRFVLPHHNELRPAWLIRLGLFIYDHLGGRKLLPATTTLRRKSSARLDSLKEEYRLAFEYSDCWVEDSRLVVLNAVDAKSHGAEVMTRTRCTSLVRSGDHWDAVLESPKGSETRSFRAVGEQLRGHADVLASGVLRLGDGARHGLDMAVARIVKNQYLRHCFPLEFHVASSRRSTPAALLCATARADVNALWG